MLHWKYVYRHQFWEAILQSRVTRFFIRHIPALIRHVRLSSVDLASHVKKFQAFLPSVGTKLYYWCSAK